MKKIAMAMVLLVLCVSCSSDNATTTSDPLSYSNYCYLESNRDIFLIHSEAVAIAKSSDCLDGMTLTGKSFCNENFGAWWLEMTTNDGGIGYYCVIDAESRATAVRTLE